LQIVNAPFSTEVFHAWIVDTPHFVHAVAQYQRGACICFDDIKTKEQTRSALPFLFATIKNPGGYDFSDVGFGEGGEEDE
jgi:hypothetical protein